MVGALDWLEAAGLVIKVNIASSSAQPLSAYVHESVFKLLAFDVGILGAMSELSPKVILDYDYRTYQGYFAENYIAQAFCAAEVPSLYCWQKNRNEVEFLRDIDGDILPIEVKSGWVTKARSLQIYAEKYQPVYRTIFSAQPFYIDTKAKLHHYPLYCADNFPC